MPGDMRDVQGNFLEGRTVTFVLGQSPDGRHKATDVKLDEADGEEVALPGAIKSFSIKNGYGFIESSSLGSDLRFDYNQIRNPPIGADLKGMLVSFKVQSTPDGKLRAERVQLQSGKKAKQLREAATVVTFGGYDQPMSQMKT